MTVRGQIAGLLRLGLDERAESNAKGSTGVN